MRKERGYTIFEMICVLSLIAILSVIALANFSEFANPSSNGASSLVGFLKQARAKALASTVAYTIKPTSTKKIATYYSDSCSSTTLTADTPLFLELPAGASLTSTSWSVCYNQRGLSDSSLQITIHDSNGSKKVQVVLGGGVRVL